MVISIIRVIRQLIYEHSPALNTIGPPIDWMKERGGAKRIRSTIMIRWRKHTTIMILKHASDVHALPITKPGFSGFTAQFLLTSDDGCPRYAMRLMEIAPGGCTSFHNHREEHEMYFLEGEGVLRTEAGGEDKVRAGDALLLMPCEFHQVRNTGTGTLKMICTVPLFPGMDGRGTTPCK